MGKAISYFLMDDSIQGRIKCKIDNWTGLVYKVPRTHVDLCKDPVFNQTGFYFLFGSGEDDKQVIYVGQASERNEGNGIISKIKEHIRNSEKDYFSEVVIVTTTDNSLDQTGISYLENYFYNLAKDCDRYEVKNSNNPTKGNVSEEMQCTLDEFADKTKTLVGVLGYKAFEETYNPNQKRQIIFEFDASDVDARGVRTPEGFVVLKGSKISNISKGHTKDWAEKLRELNKDKIKNYVTTENILFSSPSAAGNFVYNTRTNGRTYWKSNGKTLKEIEEENK